MVGREEGALTVGETIFTIGHSNHPLERFLELLRRHRIEVVVDVRSNPFARYSIQFDSGALQRALRPEAIKYVFLGDRLGGKPEGQDFYDEKGYVLYYRLAQSPRFRQGLRELVAGLGRRTVVLCSEEDPTDCHRRRLLGPVLAEEGVEVVHIRGDGRLQREVELAQEEEFKKSKGQLLLFDREEETEWKSTQSVSPKKAPPTSSDSSAEPE